MNDLIELYIGNENVKTVVEAGACDCADSKAMAVVYPNATIYAFEPNPETAEKCKQAAIDEPRIKFTSLALGDENVPVILWVNDKEKTVTPHADGNPGASSLFKANPDYPLEKYVQKPVGAKMVRFDSLNLPAPDLLWLDAQASELSILKGFGTLLKNVKIIKIEVLFKEQYFGAPLFDEVLSFLEENGFRFVRFLDKYEWFADCVFVRNDL